MTAPDAAPADEPARIIGRYELLIELASGGMGSVFVGRQRGAGGFQRLVAIKRMHAHVGSDPELAAAFQDEAHIASLIRHPNVVNVHDVYEVDGEHLLVMDYIDGVAASTLLGAVRRSRTTLPRGVALRIAIEALHGLHAAHELRALDGSSLDVVHRDVSPQNILVALDGTVRITDFGIARAAQRASHTQTGAVKGKARYMAPEQARGEAVDRRADIFALGIVLWEMLTGERLYNAADPHQIHLLAATGAVRPLSSVDPTMPGGLEAIVMRALVTEPDKRWPTAQMFSEQLETWAWHARDLGNAADVAATVVAIAGPSLEKRRNLLQEVLRGKRPVILSGGGVLQIGTPPIPSAVPQEAAVPVSSAALVQVRPKPAARAWVVGASIGVAVVAIGAAAVVVSRTGPPPTPTVQAATAAASATALLATPASSSDAAPEKRVRITLFSQQDLAEIRAPNIDQVSFQAGGASFRLPEARSPVDVTIRFADGREIHESVTPNGDAALRLSGSSAAASPAPSATAATKAGRGPSRPSAEGLRKNPYD